MKRGLPCSRFPFRPLGWLLHFDLGEKWERSMPAEWTSFLEFPGAELTGAQGHAEIQDRRAMLRVELTCPVRVLISETGLGVSGETVNLNAAGALISTRAPLRIGANYRLFVAVQDEILETRGRVLRELAGYRYAIAFERPLAPPEMVLVGA